MELSSNYLFFIIPICILFLSFIYHSYVLIRVRNQIEDYICLIEERLNPNPTSVDHGEKSSYEERLMEREKNFDDRIERLQDELSGETDLRRGTTAEEYHPNVNNLPHDERDWYNDYSPIEVAE